MKLPALPQLLPQTTPKSSSDPTLHARTPTDLAPLQQQALTERLTALLPAIPPLRVMAEAQGLSVDCALDDAPKLFFPHAIYKSYDPGWLLGLDFARMSRWLQNFTTRDLKIATIPAFAAIELVTNRTVLEDGPSLPRWDR